MAPGFRARRHSPMIIRKRTGQQAFNAIFEQTGAMASVVETESWKRPWRVMGPITYGRKKRAPPQRASIAVEVVRETEKAWLLDHEGNEFWFPKSVGDLDGDDEPAGFGQCTLTADIYWLREKGVAPVERLQG